jgi:hypothetical protein
MMKSRMRWADMWHGGRGEKMNTYRLLIREPEGKIPLGIPRRRRVDNIKMDLGEGWCGLDCSGSG